jgi:hypothetical protein
MRLVAGQLDPSAPAPGMSSPDRQQQSGGTVGLGPGVWWTRGRCRRRRLLGRPAVRWARVHGDSPTGAR